MRKTFLALCFAVLFASGCAKSGLVGSFCGPLPERGAVSAIAADAVACLSELYPPGHTSLRLLQAKDAGNEFAAAFENGLRSQGFTLAATDSADVIVVAYTLDALDEKSAWYLQLRLSDGNVIARAYTVSGQPEAGQSRTEQEFRRSFVDRATEKARHVWDSGMEALD
ncbi:hypothetical protein LJC26_05515 [Desulfovibrio sp. OttesenSCG-928-O18]|nr:hypothetical protein [Desulfovibrio sp. OttesenSCG-928-O18]